MSYVIDSRDHLAKVTQKILASILELQDLWLDEDRDATVPRRSDSVPVSGGSTSDPTFTVVTDENRHIGRDQIGRTLTYVLDKLKAELAQQKPTAEGKGRCSNCGWAPSTHGPRCEPCDRWKRRHKGEERPRQVWEAHRDRAAESAAQRRTA